VHLRADPIFGSVIPSKMFEAMGMGLPILLVAPSGEAREVLESAGAGLWTPAARPDLLVESVLRLKHDRALRARLAEASRVAAAFHSREQQAREMVDVFEAVLSAA
jgi:glycosyltransferase involved in cell wall biosynthesis